MLVKDYQTGQKSLTVTCVVITFTLTVFSVIVNLKLLCQGLEPHPSMIWACLGFCSPFVALYWRKRIKASATGIEFGELKEGGDE